MLTFNLQRRLKFLKENKLSFYERRGFTYKIGDGYRSYDYDVFFQPPIEEGHPATFPEVHHHISTVFDADPNVKYVATALIDNQLEGLDNVWRQALATASMAGLGNVPKIIWEATPWSWMVDWGLDVSSYLDNFEMQPYNGQLVVRELYMSSLLRAEGSLVSFTALEDGGLGPQSHSGLDGYLKSRKYVRSDSLPIDTSCLSPQLMVPNLTGGRIETLVALVEQRTHTIPDMVKIGKQLLRRYGK
jgi:hypothetical protein